MKALTLWQPWASLVALGAKRVETRCWDTNYRGKLAIHAAATIPPKFLGASRYQEKFEMEIAEALNVRRDRVSSAINSLPRGVVVCVVNLMAVNTVEYVRHDLGPRELTFGNYEDGRYAWFLELVETFDPPIPAKGNRKLWDWARKEAEVVA
jgi:activating signal cointegrator 1